MAISPSVRLFVIEIAWLYSLISLLAIAIAILAIMCFLRTSGESTCKLAHFGLSSVIYASNGAQ